MLRLELPWPPSVNRYWRHVVTPDGHVRTLISREGRRYRADVAAEVALRGHAEQIAELVRIRWHIRPPDRRIRDLDNVFKALLDALVYAGVLEGDHLLHAYSVERLCPGRPGLVVAEIEPLGLTWEEWLEGCHDKR